MENSENKCTPNHIIQNTNIF